MRLLYLDDSGSVKNKNEQYLVLGGICVHEKHVDDLTQSMDQLAARFVPEAAESVEFHASEIYSGKIEPWKSIIDKGARRQVLMNVLSAVAASPSGTFAMACAIHKASFPGVDHMEMAFSTVCNWFNELLRQRHAETGVDERGMIFLDQSTHETPLRRIASDFRRTARLSGRSYIIEAPVFVDSKQSRCVQMADHIAYSVFRSFHAQDAGYLSVILNRFFATPNTITGLVHLEMGIEECTCPGCLTRRSAEGSLLIV